MYAQLGDIVFEKLVGFTSFEMSGSEKYAEHNLINLQPRLDHTGTDLRQIKFDVRFHTDYCIPEDKSAALWAAKNTTSILTLVLGNGRIIGDFVILDITETVVTTFPDGTYIELISSVTLKECVVADKKTTDNQDALNKAAANKSNAPDPLRNFPAQTPTPSRQVTNFMLLAIWKAAEIEYLVTVAASDPTLFLLHTLEAQTELGDIEDNITQAMAFINPAYEAAQTASVGFIDWATENTNILASMTDVLTESTALGALMPMATGSIVAIQAQALVLQEAVAAMQEAALFTFLFTGLRKL